MIYQMVFKVIIMMAGLYIEVKLKMDCLANDYFQKIVFIYNNLYKEIKFKLYN